MTKDEALKMAIDFLGEHATDESDEGWKYIDAINACKEALEQPAQEPNCYGDGNVYRGLRSEDSKVKTYHVNTRPAPAQEPVAWMGFDEIGNADFLGFNDFNKYTTKQTVVLKKPIPLYTHPHQWQGLTDDEIEAIMMKPFIYFEFARAIEQALKEKNT